jgi:sodium/bile acid cotransporter 7
MKEWIRKRWFLLLLVLGIALAAWAPKKLQPVADLLEPKVLVAAALFIMAWCLDSKKLWGTVRRPGAAFWATAISYSLVPLLGWLGGAFVDLADFRIGLMIIASVPCTLASAILWTRMAQGNEATALLVTLLTIGTSWLITTAWVMFGTGTLVRIELQNLMLGLFLVLVIPVALGQSVQAIPALARVAVQKKTSLGVISQILIFSVIFKAAVQVFDQLQSGSSPVAITALGAVTAACLGIHLTGLVFGFWTSRALRFDRSNQIAVAFSCSQKSLPVALFLYQSYFQSYSLAVIPLAIYHVGQLVVDTFIAERWAAHQEKISMPDDAPILS